MSANTLTARSSVRNPKTSRTTRPTYPRYAEPRRASRPLAQSSRVYRPSGIYGIANRNAAPISVPKLKPYTRALKKRIASQLAMDFALAIYSGARSSLRILDNTVFNYSSTSMANNNPPWWIPASDVVREATGWRIHHVRINSVPPYASYAACPSWEYSYYNTLSVFIADSATAISYLYKWDVPNGWTYFRKTTNSVTGNQTWPFGQSEVQTQVPRYAFSPAPFPVSPKGHPRYYPNRQPRLRPRTDPKLNRAARGNATGVEIGFTNAGKFYARYRRTKGGRDKFERKSGSQKALVVLSAILDFSSEAIEVYEILREGFGVPDDVQGFDALEYMADNWSDATWDQIAIDLAINHYSDKIVGRVHGSMREGFKNLDFGTLAKLNMSI